MAGRNPQSFVADPAPLGGDKVIVPWAKRQFEALQRILTASGTSDLQARVDRLEKIIGDGTWDGGEP